LSAVHKGVRWLEVPTRQRPRIAGRSKITGSAVGSVRAGYAMLRTAIGHGG
jgi:hypothetical protein